MITLISLLILVALMATWAIDTEWNKPATKLDWIFLMSVVFALFAVIYRSAIA